MIYIINFAQHLS